MKALHYIAAETNFRAGTLIWLGKLQKRIRKFQLKRIYVILNGHKTKHDLQKKFIIFTPMEVD